MSRDQRGTMNMSFVPINAWRISFALIIGRLLSLVLAIAVAYPASATEKRYGPGVSDTEIKIGNTMPYSGPISNVGTIGRAEVAYFQMLNEHGGVNGRKITFISLDDAYSAPKTMEQVRKLVEQEQVQAIFGLIGTPTGVSQRARGAAAVRAERRRPLCGS